MKCSENVFLVVQRKGTYWITCQLIQVVNLFSYLKTELYPYLKKPISWTMVKDLRTPSGWNLRVYKNILKNV